MRARANLDGLGGEIAIGRFVVRIGDSRGAGLHEATRADRSRVRPRPVPIQQRPRLLRGLLDRRSEVAAIISALDAGVAVEISGGPGVGKTALLRHLAHHPRAASFTDGILYLSATQQTPLDLLQRIFDAFFDSDPIAKPTDPEMRRALQDKQALILIDDFSLSPSGAEQILDVAPRCSFVLAARERRLWNEVRSLPLEGLPVEDAVALLGRELERPLDGTIESAAARLCGALGGHPLRIQQAAALIRERAIPFERWERLLASESLLGELLTSLDERDRRVLLSLAALGGPPVDAQHVSGIAELSDVEASLLTLVRRGLVVRYDARYRLADGVADRLRRGEDVRPWVNRAITYFVAWAERHRRSREHLLQTSAALARVQQHALDTKRWGEALRLGRLLEVTLVLSARWGTWGEALERSLSAAKAIGDRAAEAWVLHEIGTRAVCLDDADTARRALNQARLIREELGETGAADISRKNLGFVITETAEDAPRVHPMPFDDAWNVDAAIDPDHLRAARRGALVSEVGAMLIACLLCATLGWFTYLAVCGRGSIFRRADPGASRPTTASPSSTAPSPPHAPAPSAIMPSTPAPAPAPTPPQRADILIFTARPGSIASSGSTRLCYAVRDALHTRIEPGVGEVDSASTLTCRHVVAPRTTTYELTAVGRDGVQVKQQLVIVAR